MRRLILGLGLAIIMASVGVTMALAQQQSFRDANGHFSGSAITHGNSTSFYDRNGSFTGSAIRNGNDTNFYGTHGHYQGTSTVNPSSFDRAFNFKR